MTAPVGDAVHDAGSERRIMLEEELTDPRNVKIAQPDHPIHPLLSQRWSPRAFSGRDVGREDLLALFEAARWAPSSGNGQPWSFIAATRADENTFAALVACLDSGNAEWAPRAPVLALAVARTVRNGKPAPGGLYDLGLAVMNLALEATQRGLHIHQMGGFSKDAARERFEIPPDHEPVVMIAIGYLGDLSDLDTLSQRNRERELTARVRKHLREFVFGQRWGETSPLVEGE